MVTINRLKERHSTPYSRNMKHNKFTEKIANYMERNGYRVKEFDPLRFGFDFFASKEKELILVKAYSGTRKLSRKEVERLAEYLKAYEVIFSDIASVIAVVFLMQSVSIKVRYLAKKQGIWVIPWNDTHNDKPVEELIAIW